MTSTTQAPAPRGYIGRLWARREFLWYLIKGQLRARHAYTTLGTLWWIVNPTLLAAIYLVVFGKILGFGRRGDIEYLGYLLSGIFAFYYTRTSVASAGASITGNAKLMVNVAFPRLLLPIASVAESAVGYLASLGVYLVAVGSLAQTVPWDHVWIVIPTFILHTLFNLGLAAAVARLVVPFKDFNNVVNYALRAWLYLSPIIYEVKQLPEVLQRFGFINPLFPFLELYRYALNGLPMVGDSVLWAVFWAFFWAIVGSVWFVRSEGKMVRYL